MYYLKNMIREICSISPRICFANPQLTNKPLTTTINYTSNDFTITSLLVHFWIYFILELRSDLVGASKVEFKISLF
jgi:hypothetical protein